MTITMSPQEYEADRMAFLTEKAEKEPLWTPEEQEIQDRHGGKWAIECFETGETFPNYKAAAVLTGISPKRIKAALQSRRSIEGLTFFKSSDVMPPTATAPPHGTRGSNKKTRLRCKETGQVFDSIGEAADWAGMELNGLSEAIRNHWRCGGYRWEKVKE